MFPNKQRDLSLKVSVPHFTTDLHKMTAIEPVSFKVEVEERMLALLWAWALKIICNEILCESEMYVCRCILTNKRYQEYNMISFKSVYCWKQGGLYCRQGGFIVKFQQNTKWVICPGTGRAKWKNRPF